MNKTIKFSEITRNIPQDSTPDGSCQEIINMRYRKGAFRPIGAKVVLHDAAYTYLGAAITFKKIYLHDIEDGLITGQPNWIGYHETGTAGVYLINPVTGICTLIDTVTDPNTYTTVTFLKRTMIITANSGLLVYLYTNETAPTYGKIGNLPTPYVDLFSKDTINPAPAIPIRATITSDSTHTPEAVLGNFYEIVNQQSHLYGRLYGSIMYITAFRLFDGSFVMPSVPRYLEISNGGILHQHNPSGSGWDNADWRWVITFGSVAGILVTGNYPSAQFEAIKDLVDSIVVFATKATPIYKVDDTTVTEKVLQAENYPNYTYVDIDRNFTTTFPMNSPDFEDLAKSAGWYQIMEYQFSDVVGDTVGTIVKMADTKNFYQDYATRKTLPTDQFSHHSLVAKHAYVYNDRIHVLNVRTTFGIPSILWPLLDGYTASYNRQAVIVVYLSTSLGKAVLVNQCQIPAYHNTSNGLWYICWNGIVGYPDSRATKMELAVQDGTAVYRTVFSVSLKKNEGLNSAYYHRTEFALVQPASADYNYNPRMILESALGAAYTIPTAKTTPYDTNRLQVSEIQNPLVYPAKNSYQIGTGEGMAMASGSEPLSTGQYGQFPLQVFTSKGRYALQQGNGDILYQSVQNIDGEVADNPMNVISMGSGVLYSTEKGLFVGIGQQVTKLSESVEGTPHLLFNTKAEIQKMLTDTRCTPGLAGSLSDEDFLDYLHDSSIGYDQLNKEVIVTKAGAGYSYIYSVENKIWFKISQSFDLLINSYPTVLGISGSKVYDLGDDDHAGNTSVMIVTNAMSLEMSGIYKKIERMIVRSFNSTPTESYLGVYLFGTDDLATYQLLTGRQRTGVGLQNLIVQRSQGSCKYYVIVYNGVITHDSTLSTVDIAFIERLAKKIR